MKLLRLLYQILLLLHPAGFRKRFGKEMLEIFDSSAGDGHTVHLLFDGARSIFIQHARPIFQEEKAAAFCLEVQTSSLTAAQLTQATVLGGTLFMLLVSVFVREIPPIPVFKNQPACHESDGPKPQVTMEIKQ